jgi:Glycyl-tRNA synthetase (class II)
MKPSAGCRQKEFLALLNEAYKNEKIDKENSRIVLALKPHLSPIKAAVIPLKKNNEKIVALSQQIKISLQKIGLGRVMLENSGNIGKNYRRHDEIGTPICVTVDFESLDDNTVTVRDRDTMNQKRISLDQLIDYYKNYFN